MGFFFFVVVVVVFFFCFDDPYTTTLQSVWTCVCSYVTILLADLDLPLKTGPQTHQHVRHNSRLVVVDLI